MLVIGTLGEQGSREPGIEGSRFARGVDVLVGGGAIYFSKSERERRCRRPRLSKYRMTRTGSQGEGPRDPGIGRSRTERCGGRTDLGSWGWDSGLRVGCGMVGMRETEAPIVRPCWLVKDISFAITADQKGGAPPAIQQTDCRSKQHAKKRRTGALRPRHSLQRHHSLRRAISAMREVRREPRPPGVHLRKSSAGLPDRGRPRRWLQVRNSSRGPARIFSKSFAWAGSRSTSSARTCSTFSSSVVYSASQWSG